MAKYRIIKSIAANKERPYFPQYWDYKQDRWANFQTVPTFGWGWEDLSFETLKEAKKYIWQQQEQDRIDATPPEVVWEEENE